MDRSEAYFRYLVEKGAARRWGPDWRTPERVERLDFEIEVIATAKQLHYFLILERIMRWMREQKIPYGFGRGSVGGSLACFALGIHDADSLKYGLLFDRFMNSERVSLPDVDIDVSQRHRQRVLAFIREEFDNDETAVLQVAAYSKAGARSTVDMVAAANRDDPQAFMYANQLKAMLPEGAAVTGGTRQEFELDFWMTRIGPEDVGWETSNQCRFQDLARKIGWYDHLMKIDGAKMHLTQHAAGVVIVRREDLPRMPQTSYDGINMMTAYDMYSLEALDALKIDILGLRTLDIISDADILSGGDGTTPHMFEIWQRYADNDPAAYELLCEADSLGVFQVETTGYRRTLKSFKPKAFEDIVQLNALYRPGALDVKRADGKNMVDVYIERRHGRETNNYGDLADVLGPILDTTQGIFLFQEQAMRAAVVFAGFTTARADNLRKAIGKKQLSRMAQIKPEFIAGAIQNGHTEEQANRVWAMIDGASRYSWNRSHSVFYGAETFLCAHFKANHKAAFMTAVINSLDKDKDRQAEAIAEARQHCVIRPPDINVAQEQYTLDEQGRIVFGLNGIKGMGEANRAAIVIERGMNGPYGSFQEFQDRLSEVPINMKLSLIRCGAFDSLEIRAWLLSTCVRRDNKGNPLLDKDGNQKTWTVAEHIKHNAGLKVKRPLPDITDVNPPDDEELAKGELESIGFYVSADPMADVNAVLARLNQTIHWGGEIEKVHQKNDKNGNAMANFSILTPALTKQRCRVFASNWEQCKPLAKPGQRVILRGSMDNGVILVERIFKAGDYRQFEHIRMRRDGEDVVQKFDGKIETVKMAEASGFKVNLI